jgi:hypothetical protein
MIRRAEITNSEKILIIYNHLRRSIQTTEIHEKEMKVSLML